MINIPHSRPVFGQPFTNVVNQVVEAGQLACGQNTKALEPLISNELGLQHTLAVDSGTSALMLAIRSLTQHKNNARVGIPSYACASLLFAVKAAGAQPVFMDYNASLTLNAEQAIKAAKTLDVLVLVHPFGMVEPLAADSFPCPTIEDIAQSVGATLQGKQVGSFADICIGSLYATKPWGGAYGGFISSNNTTHIESCRSMINPDNTDLSADYVGHHLLSNIHATLASQRIKQARQEQNKRQSWATQYNALFDNIAATPIHSTEHSKSNYFRYIVRCEQPAEAVIQRFKVLGIAASRPVQQPLHHSEKATNCPQTDSAWQHCVSLPLLSDMTDQEFAHMQQGITTCFNS